MPTFISARVYARPAQWTDAARRRPPRHADHRRRAAERRLLHARARAPARQEDRQPGRPDRLPPLLCRREGQRRRRHHVLRVSGRDARQGRPGDDAHDRLAGRVGRRARLLGAAAGGRGRERRPLRREPRRSRTPEGVRHELRVVETDDEPLVARHPEIPEEHALQGFDGVRAYAIDPERSTALLEDTLGFTPARRLHLGGAGRRSAAAGTPTTPRPRGAASPAPAPSTTSPGRRRSRSTRPGSSASPKPGTGRRP